MARSGKYFFRFLLGAPHCCTGGLSERSGFLDEMQHCNQTVHSFDRPEETRGGWASRLCYTQSCQDEGYPAATPNFTRFESPDVPLFSGRVSPPQKATTRSSETDASRIREALRSSTISSHGCSPRNVTTSETHLSLLGSPDYPCIEA